MAEVIEQEGRPADYAPQDTADAPNQEDHKYRTGVYHVAYFNRYGTDISRTKPPEATRSESMLSAVEAGHSHTGNRESFVVTRVVFNSLDDHDFLRQRSEK